MQRESIAVKFRNGVSKLQIVISKHQVVISKLQSVISKLQNVISKLQYVISKLQNAMTKLQDVISKFQNVVPKLRNGLQKLQNDFCAGFGPLQRQNHRLYLLRQWSVRMFVRPRPGGETGIHEGLKIPWGQPRAGSNPAPGIFRRHNTIPTNGGRSLTPPVFFLWPCWEQMGTNS